MLSPIRGQLPGRAPAPRNPIQTARLQLIQHLMQAGGAGPNQPGQQVSQGPIYQPQFQPPAGAPGSPLPTQPFMPPASVPGPVAIRAPIPGAGRTITARPGGLAGGIGPRY